MEQSSSDSSWLRRVGRALKSFVLGGGSEPQSCAPLASNALALDRTIMAAMSVSIAAALASSATGSF